MLTSSAYLSVLATCVTVVIAQSGPWEQCGGVYWTGATTCIAGWTCVFSNDYYSQCLQTTSTVSALLSCSDNFSILICVQRPSQPRRPFSSTVSTSTVSTTTTSTTAPTSTALNAIAQAVGKKYFGSATDNGELSNAAYVAILDDNTMFGQITPANSMKWDATEPSRGTFTFTNGDVIASLAKKNGQLLRGHNCRGFNAATLTSILQTHCSTVVILHAFNDDGTWRSFVFYQTLGSNYVTIALQAARAADPNAKLYINDYNTETVGAKSNALLSLATSLKSSGVPLDGIGFQCHFIVGQTPSTASLVSNFQRFTALGLEVAITELDIRMTLPSTAALLAQQATDYQNVIAACKAVAGCVGATIWDYTDEQRANHPSLQNLNRKPAYNGIAAGWKS
ncbi:endo-1,4-beta-xylanase A precursor [Mycena sp. CBHHK59/15]|nr:endo-1,4-beta-xylanase A precursor [Mycena sp. CBHHK59/15]